MVNKFELTGVQDRPIPLNPYPGKSRAGDIINHVMDADRATFRPAAASQYAEAEIGDVLFVDEPTGRSVVRTNDKSNSGAVHSGFAPVEPKDVIIPYLAN
jgi:hypothetical protein